MQNTDISNISLINVINKAHLRMYALLIIGPIFVEEFFYYPFATKIILETFPYFSVSNPKNYDIIVIYNVYVHVCFAIKKNQILRLSIDVTSSFI